MHSHISTDSLNHLWYSDFAVFLKGIHHQTIAADVVNTLRKEVKAKDKISLQILSPNKLLPDAAMLAVGRAPHVISAAFFLNAENNLKSSYINSYFLSVNSVTVYKTPTWLMSLVHADFSCREDATRMTV